MLRFFLVLLTLLPPALSAAGAGTLLSSRGEAWIESVKRDARGAMDVVTTPAKAGSVPEAGDTILTGPDGRVALRLSDGTEITIGKNSRFLIEAFHDSPDPARAEARFRLVKGAFRAITGQIGKIAPEKFTIRVRTSAIGIRGTDLLVKLYPDSAFNAACLKGAIGVVRPDVYDVTVPAGEYTFVRPDATKARPPVARALTKEILAELFEAAGLPPEETEKGTKAPRPQPSTPSVKVPLPVPVPAAVGAPAVLLTAPGEEPSAAADENRTEEPAPTPDPKARRRPKIIRF